MKPIIKADCFRKTFTPHIRRAGVLWFCLLLLTPVEAAEILVGNHILSGNTRLPTGNILRFDADTGAFKGEFVKRDASPLALPQDLVFGPDGQLYVASVESAGSGGSVLRFNGKTGAFIDVFIQPERPKALAFGPDGNLYVAPYFSNAGKVNRYDGRAGVLIDEFVIPFGGAISSGVAFGPDGHLYVSNFSHGMVVRFDVRTGQFIDVFLSRSNTIPWINSPEDLAFSLDGKVLCVQDSGGTFCIDVQTRQFLGVFEGSAGLSFDPNDRLFHASYSRKNPFSVHRYDFRTNTRVSLVPDGSGGLGNPQGVVVVPSAEGTTADLATVVSPSIASFPGGGAWVWHWIGVSNWGPDAASNVQMTETVTATGSFTMWSGYVSPPTDWSCSVSNNQLNCNRLTPQPPNHTDWIGQWIYVPAGNSGSQITGAASVTTTANDPYAPNNTASGQVGVP